MLTFIIPVRHQATVRDWSAIKARLAVTLRSLHAQDNPNWNAVIVANHGAELPEDLGSVDVARVDLSPNRVDPAAPKEQIYEAVRHDKGHRVLAGLRHAQPKGHVMVVDYDDMVSRRLAGFVDNHPDANGWYVNSGYFFSGNRVVYLCARDFFEWCGTSHIVRADLLRLPAHGVPTPEIYVRRTLGSHKFIKRDLEHLGAPLAPLPFPGAVYRMGHGDTVTGSQNAMTLHVNRHALYKPLKLLRDVARLRIMGRSMAHEFFGGRPA